MPLAAGMGVRLGPLVFITALRHFLEKRLPEASKARDELLYDEAFVIVKTFLEASSRHTVEDLQEFANTRIPASHNVKSVRLLVPLSTCALAAKYLIEALGGEASAARVAGGTRWWQVRGLQGIDANWIAMKKDVEIAQQERKRRKQSQDVERKERNEQTPTSERDKDKEGTHEEYSKDWDPLRCMYYIHGGGYFFGSVDQERYCMQRYARKMNGRVFAINYRLAPQYPFPYQLICLMHSSVLSPWTWNMLHLVAIGVYTVKKRVARHNSEHLR